jgi:hypothetical protein
MSKFINVKNTEKIQKLINVVEGRATSRCLNVKKIEKAVLCAENKLKKLGIPKKYWIDTKIYFHPGKVCNSYEWSAKGTYATIIRKPSGWFVVDISRDNVYKQSSGSNSSVNLILSDISLMSSYNMFRLDT